jgi:hypothetical protein
MIEIPVNENGKSFTAYSPSTLYLTTNAETSIDGSGSIVSSNGDIELTIRPTCNSIVVDATRLEISQLHFNVDSFWFLLYHGSIPKHAILKVPT